MGYDDPVGPCVYCGTSGAPIGGLCVDCGNKADRQASMGYDKSLNNPKTFNKPKKKPKKHKENCAVTQKDEVRFIQCWTGNFQFPGGALTYSTFGLSNDGKVFRFDPKCDAWIPWSMKIATCKNDHPHKR